VYVFPKSECFASRGTFKRFTRLITDSKITAIDNWKWNPYIIYNLACKLDFKKVQDLLMDFIRSSDSVNDSFLAPQRIGLRYNSAPPDTVLRRYLVQLFQYGTELSLRSGLRMWDAELVNKFMADNHAFRIESFENLIRDRRNLTLDPRTDRCRFHISHEVGNFLVPFLQI